MLSEEIRRSVSSIAVGYGLDPEAGMAFVHVESGGKAYAPVDGNNEPLIRWEGHYFYRLIGNEKSDKDRKALQDRAVKAGLADKSAGVIKNPDAQQDRWDKLLKPGMALDRDAALESCSWGLLQVMGANFAMLGFDSVRTMVSTARSGIDGQIDIGFRYIVKAGLRDAMNRHDWASLAHGYNGPNYKKYKYDEQLAEAYAKYRPISAGPTGDPNVRYLQERLNLHGAKLEVDGRRGPKTTAAIVEFQKTHDLEPDGIVGRFTLAELNKDPT